LRKCRRSAKWFGAVTRVNGSLDTVLLYQLNSGLPNSPREFFGCGDWFISTLTSLPTIRTERPRYGVGNSASAWEPSSAMLPFACCAAVSDVRAILTSSLRSTQEGGPFTSSRICGQGHLSPPLILVFGAPRDGDGAADFSAFDARQRPPTRHDPAVARHHQALKPALPGDCGQFLCRLLKARRR